MYNGTELYHSKSTDKRLCIEGDRPSLSLADLLACKGKKFSLRERRILAVILAQTMLHFSDSPWLGKKWNKRHVKFFWRTAGYDLKRPYLTTTFKQRDPDQKFNVMEVHPNPSVLALGVLLLEIELWKNIEDCRDKGDLSSEGIAAMNIDLFTAKRLFNQRFDDMTMNYQIAIDACLKCNLVEPGQPTTLDDEQFRQAVYDQIVEPLEEELFHACHIRPHQLSCEEPIRREVENSRSRPRSSSVRSTYWPEYDPSIAIRSLASVQSDRLSLRRL
jgi:hypothetical protein